MSINDKKNFFEKNFKKSIDNHFSIWYISSAFTGNRSKKEQKNILKIFKKTLDLSDCIWYISSTSSKEEGNDL